MFWRISFRFDKVTICSTKNAHVKMAVIIKLIIGFVLVLCGVSEESAARQKGKRCDCMDQSLYKALTH